MKAFYNLLLALCVATTLGVVLYVGLQAYHWKKNVDLRGYKAEQVYEFLAAPAAKDVTRAQVLDFAVQGIVKQSQANQGSGGSK